MIGAIAGDIIGSIHEHAPIKHKACIAGAVAEAFYTGVPQAIVAQVEARLTPDLLNVTQRFREVYP